MTDYESHYFTSVGMEEPLGTDKKKNGIDVNKLNERPKQLDQRHRIQY